ncbi:MAG: hypothetical protein AAGE52_41300, partial [Myxococcota bacterium]
ITSAWTWKRANPASLIAAGILTAGTITGGLFALVRGGRDLRFLGRGLLAGSAVSVLWLIGGALHASYRPRSRRRWYEYLAPEVSHRGGALSVRGQF